MMRIVFVHIVHVLVWVSFRHIFLDASLHCRFWDDSLEAIVASVIERVASVLSSLSIDVHVWDCSQELVGRESVVVFFYFIDHSLLSIVSAAIRWGFIRRCCWSFI